MMQTGEARNSVKANGVQNLSVPPGFVSRTAFILKRMVSGEDTQNPAHKKNVSDITPLSSHGLSSLEDNALEANLQIKHRAWIIHDQLDHHEKELDDEPNHENVEIASEGCLPKGLIWGCSACSNCLKVPAQWDLEGARSVKLEEAPVFQPTDEEFKDTLKYIESISQQVKPYGLCRIVPPPSWQPPCLFGENNACEGFNFSTQVQRITDFRNCSKRKGLASRNVQESKRRRISKLDLDNESGNGDTVNFEVLGSPQAEQFQFQFGPHFTFESFKKNADYFKECYFQKKSKVVNPEEASHVTCHQQWEPSEEDIEGEYWRILEKPTAEIEVLRRANLDAESLRNRVLESLKTETSNSNGYQDSGWNLSNLSRLPGSLLSLENSDYLGDLAPKFQIGMCFSTLPWELAEHHLYTLCCLHLGAPKIWYGVPGHYFSRFQEAVKKHFPGIFVRSPELLHKLAMQVSPSTLKAEGIPVYRCIQRPNEFILFLPGAYHTGFDCGFNVSESVCCATLEWLPHGQSAIELYREKQMKQLICPDKLLMRAAHEAVKARWEYLLKGMKTPAVMRWKDACGKDSAIAETLKVRVKAEIGQRKFLCTNSQARKMDKCFDVEARKECCTCNSILYLSAAFCPCNPNKYACLKHTKNLCTCAWSEKVFVLRFNVSELNLLVEATEGNFSAINRWVKETVGYALECDTTNPNINVIPEDESNTDKALEHKSDTSFSSVDGTIVKKAHEKLVAETMTRILRVSSIDGSKSKLFDTWISSAAVDSSSDSDDERSFLPLPSKDKKPLAESHSATNGQATGSSELGRGNQETKSSGKSDIAMEVVNELAGNPVRQKRQYERKLTEKETEVFSEDEVGPVCSDENVVMEDAPTTTATEDPDFTTGPSTIPEDPNFTTGPPEQDPPEQQPPQEDPSQEDPPPPQQDPPEQQPPQEDPPQEDPPQEVPPQQVPPPLEPAQQYPPVLMNFDTHIAELIWRKALLDPPENVVRSLRVQTRPTQFEFWRDRIPRGVPKKGSWFWIVQQTGLTGLLDFQFGNADHTLISAFVERWHPETNTFHFSFGEIGPTLHDVMMILGLPIEGFEVTSPWTGQDSELAECEALFEYLFGIDSEYNLDEDDDAMVCDLRKGRVKQFQLRRHVLRMIEEGAYPEDIAAGFLWHIMSASIFVDKSTNELRTTLLPLFVDWDRVVHTAWGTGVLALLFRNLGEASRRGAAQLAGCARLLEVWIWTYFVYFPGNPNLKEGADDDLRRAARYCVGRTPVRLSGNQLHYRRILDEYRPEDIRWMPYEGLDFRGAHRASTYRGTIRFLGVEEPYMPDRLTRQFGYRQSRPLDIIEPRVAVRPHDFKGTRRYLLYFDPRWHRWDQFEHHLCPYILTSPLATMAWDVDDAYLDWYLQVSHPYVSPHAPVQPRICRGPPPAINLQRRVAMGKAFVQDIIEAGGGNLLHWQHIYDILASGVIPVAPPLVRASQMSSQSSSVAESSSAAETRARWQHVHSIFDREKAELFRMAE